MKCLFHNSDQDGYCSGAIVKYLYPNCQLIGVNYGYDVPWNKLEEGESVIIVDFSFDPGELLELSKRQDLHWIDHHNSSIRAQENTPELYNVPGIRDERYAGCELTWQYFFPDELQSQPTVVTYCGRYDVWDHSDPSCLDFHYGMQVEFLWPEIKGKLNSLWESLLDGNQQVTSKILKNGIIIHRYEQSIAKRISHSAAFITTIDGYRALAVNQLSKGSKFLESFWDPNEYDLMILFGWRAKFGEWSVTLATNNETSVNASEIAERYGGGGHSGIAGFGCQELPFELTNVTPIKKS